MIAGAIVLTLVAGAFIFYRGVRMGWASNGSGGQSPSRRSTQKRTRRRNNDRDADSFAVTSTNPFLEHEH